MNMKYFSYIVLLIVFTGTQGKVGMPGGPTEVTAEDTDYVERGKTFIEKDLKGQLEGEDNDHAYITTLLFSDYKVTKQVVNGWLYNYVFKLTSNFKCVNNPTSNRLCLEKASVTEDWKASVWYKPYSEEPQYGTGKQPTKVKDN